MHAELKARQEIVYSIYGSNVHPVIVMYCNLSKIGPPLKINPLSFLNEVSAFLSGKYCHLFRL